MRTWQTESEVPSLKSWPNFNQTRPLWTTRKFKEDENRVNECRRSVLYVDSICMGKR